MKLIKILLVLFIIGCGYPKPKQIEGTNEYQLAYCPKEEKCFKAAEKQCPNGFVVTQYGQHPEKFICK